MDITEVMDGLEGTIVDELSRELHQMVSDGEAYHPFIGRVCRDLEEYVLRKGRRIASCSTLMVYRGYTGRTDEPILKVCAGIELFRHSILAHDDIADAEVMRRGREVLHRLFSLGYDEHFGASAAIFAGNMLLARSIGCILDSGFQADMARDAVRLLFSGYREVNESQVLDLLFEHSHPEVQEWRAMAGRRAASLFRASMLSGAILAAAPKADLGLIEEAAQNMGYAFDIQDDIIDTFASREQYGREPGGDLLKGKKPLHVILAIQRDPEIATLMKTPLGEGGLHHLIDRIRESGALEEAKAISREHGGRARELISRTEMRDESKEFLVALIGMVEESLDWYR